MAGDYAQAGFQSRKSHDALPLAAKNRALPNRRQWRAACHSKQLQAPDSEDRPTPTNGESLHGAFLRRRRRGAPDFACVVDAECVGSEPVFRTPRPLIARSSTTGRAVRARYRRSRCPDAPLRRCARASSKGMTNGSTRAADGTGGAGIVFAKYRTLCRWLRARRLSKQPRAARPDRVFRSLFSTTDQRGPLSSLVQDLWGAPSRPSAGGRISSLFSDQGLRLVSAFQGDRALERRAANSAFATRSSATLSG